ncbi:CoA transferase [Pseudosulfitobacter pseudonitzschiae]|uniref:CoA transferase n=1 Tax=Pseudosulfitobacter pseudonitzschiae TaxID=1402135 RepID=UPI00177AFFDE
MVPIETGGPRSELRRCRWAAGRSGGCRTARTAADIPLADVGAALFAAIAILSAVVSSERRRQGRYVDVSMSDAGVSMLTRLVPAANARRWANSSPTGLWRFHLQGWQADDAVHRA